MRDNYYSFLRKLSTSFSLTIFGWLYFSILQCLYSVELWSKNLTISVDKIVDKNAKGRKNFIKFTE